MTAAASLKSTHTSFLLAICLTLGWAAGAWAETPRQDAPGVSSNPTPWDATIAAFAAADREHAPPPGGVVFVGSSSIRMWDDLESRFRDAPVIIKRGFGGSKMSDCVRFLDKLVIPYKPRMVLVYAGDNDLAEGKKPADILRSFRQFVDGIHKRLPSARISYISIKPSPARAYLIPQMRETNQLIFEDTVTGDNLDYIDVFTPMLDEHGSPRAELFRADRLHLNSSGYALWRKIIAPHVH